VTAYSGLCGQFYRRRREPRRRWYMGLFSKREMKPRECGGCKLRDLAVLQLRRELSFWKSKRNDRISEVQSQKETIDTLRGVIDSLGKNSVSSSETDESIALRIAHKRLLGELDDAAEEDDEAIDSGGLTERIDEVHMGGWSPPDSGPPGDIFLEVPAESTETEMKDDDNAPN
jgi:hypothetical protein